MIHIFIVNSNAGNKEFANGLRVELSHIEDIEYYVFDVRYAGYEVELLHKVQHIFEDEKLRIYCCGGSGTLRNVINGIEDLDKVEIAFYPCGVSNEFIKNFSLKEQERFLDIHELIDGDVVSVDYIKSNLGICLNTFSTGYDARILKKASDYSFFSLIKDDLAINMAIALSLFRVKTLYCELNMSDKHYVDEYAEIFFGNGNTFLGDLSLYPNPNISDGLGKAVLFRKNAKRFFSIPFFNDMKKKRYENLRLLGELADTKEINFRRMDDGPIYVNMDGEIKEGRGTVHANIVNKGLHLVVPKGVKV